MEVPIAYRRQYLANGITTEPLGHPANRSLSAARRSGDHGPVVSLPTSPCNSSPDKGACSAILDLTTFVRELGAADGTTLSMIRTNLDLLMALTMKIAEERRGAKGRPVKKKTLRYRIFRRRLSRSRTIPETIGNEAIVISVNRCDNPMAPLRRSANRHGRYDAPWSASEIGAYAYLDAV